MSRHLITSALPYINGVKHLGNLIGSMLPADVYARYLRARGRRRAVHLRDRRARHAGRAWRRSRPGSTSPSSAGMQHEIQAELGAPVRALVRLLRPQLVAAEPRADAALRPAARGTRAIEERIDEADLLASPTSASCPTATSIGTCPHCGYERARGDQCENCTRVLDPIDLIEPRSAISGSAELEVRESRHLFLMLPALAPEVRAWIETRERLAAADACRSRSSGSTRASRTAASRATSAGACRSIAPGFEDKVFYVWFDAPIEYIGATKEWADAATGAARLASRGGTTPTT